MKLYKVLENDYLIAIGENIGGVEITESEYNTIMQKIQTKPTDPDGYTYKLRADNLEWELVELPEEDEPEDDEISSDEALDIILGGAEA